MDFLVYFSYNDIFENEVCFIKADNIGEALKEAKKTFVRHHPDDFQKFEWIPYNSFTNVGIYIAEIQERISARRKSY